MKEGLKVRVDEIRQAAIDIKLFCLSSADARQLPAFSAGSHIDVEVEPGLIRQYSLCGHPDDPSRYWIGVKLEAASRGGSQSLHTRINKGTELTISSPRNNFPLSESAGFHLLIAGGIGVTPMMSMMHSLRRNGERHRLEYFARSDDHIAFRDLLDGHPEVVYNLGMSPAGVETKIKALLAEEVSGRVIYVCGPSGLIKTVRETAAALGIGDVRTELFTNALTETDPLDDKEFMVQVGEDGDRIRVPSGVTIIQALADAGVYIDTSCEEGVCGTCAANVLCGIPEHRDEVLSPQDKASNKRIVPCVSRSRTDLLVIEFE
jgi:vanillate O-demethylase ferredoxin subunit